MGSDLGSFRASAYTDAEPAVVWRSVSGAYVALHLLLVATLPFLRIGSFKVSGLTIAATDLIFLPAALIWLLAVALRIAPLRRTSFYVPLALYLLAVLVSAAFSAAPRASLGKAVAVVYLAGLAILTVNVLDSAPKIQRVVRCWLLVSAITAGAALLGSVLFYLGLRDRQINLVLWNYGSLPPGNYPRIYGFFANGNMLCNYVIVSACLTLYARRTGLLTGPAAAALLAGLGITAALTISAGLGGLAVAVAVWLMCMADNRAKRLRARLALVGALGIAAAFQLATSISTTDAGLTPSSRALAWQGALQTFLAHPIVGKGVGAEVADAYWRNPSGVMEHLTEAHNVWLSVAAQEGALGLLAFASLVGWLLWRWRRPAPGADRVLISALGAAFCRCPAGAGPERRPRGHPPPLGADGPPGRRLRDAPGARHVTPEPALSEPAASPITPGSVPARPSQRPAGVHASSPTRSVAGAGRGCSELDCCRLPHLGCNAHGCNRRKIRSWIFSTAHQHPNKGARRDKGRTARPGSSAERPCAWTRSATHAARPAVSLENWPAGPADWYMLVPQQRDRSRPRHHPHTPSWVRWPSPT